MNSNSNMNLEGRKIRMCDVDAVKLGIGIDPHYQIKHYRDGRNPNKEARMIFAAAYQDWMYSGMTQDQAIRLAISAVYQAGHEYALQHSERFTLCHSDDLGGFLE